MLRNFLLVGMGGAVGAMMRYGVTLLTAALGGAATLATMSANIVGSFLMGLIVGLCSNNPWLLFATVGVCGGFTTFSTFSLQSITLMQSGRWPMALLYMALTLLLCLLFTFLGYRLAR